MTTQEPFRRPIEELADELDREADTLRPLRSWGATVEAGCKRETADRIRAALREVSTG